MAIEPEHFQRRSSKNTSFQLRKMSNQRNRCVIVVPIYKKELDYDEFHSVSQLFKILSPEKYDIVAVGPMSLDISYYDEQFNFKDYYQFYDEYFKNYPRGYNKLML